tara:strand:+ start:450 stop:1289 length:840 start_codon:yes stop_codon:yes gene_type:complete
MAGTKTNERPGTRAQVKYVRSSAYKVREVLNLIRGKSFFEATDILSFSERRISDTVLKCLNSAAANAENNDNISVEELYISACYADEGPTLKRWRPRARGRATRIRKRTSHITLILGRYTPEELAEIRERAELKGSRTQQSATESRKRRVEKSKESDLQEEPEETTVNEDSATDVKEDAPSVEDASDNADEAPYGTGSASPLEDGSAPSADFVIKGKVSTKIYHPEESSFFVRTKADVWFTDAETAEAAGFRLPSSMQKDQEAEETKVDQNQNDNGESE